MFVNISDKIPYIKNIGLFSLIRFILIVFLLLLKINFLIQLPYCIIFQIFDVTVNFDFLILFTIIMFIILEYKKYLNEFYNFFFFLSYLLCFIIIFLCIIKEIFLEKELIDYFINVANFKIRLIYSYNYKLVFYKEVIENYLTILNFNIEEKQFILNLIYKDVESFIKQNPNLYLIELLNYVVGYTEIAIKVYAHMPEILNHLYKDDTEHIISLLKKLLITATCIKSGSKIIVSLFLQNNLYLYIYRFLVNINVFFDASMTQEEKYDYCRRLAVIMLRKWSYIKILVFCWNCK